MSGETCWSSTLEHRAFKREPGQRIMHVDNLNVVDQGSSMIDDRFQSQ